LVKKILNLLLLELQTHGLMRRKLVDKIRELVRTEADLEFLLQLGGMELDTLIASIREGLDRVGQ